MAPGPQNWQRVEALFLHAVELPFAERAAWLAGQCGEDHELRRQVEAMLAADHSAGAKLSAAVGPAAGSVSQLTTVSDAGRRIGPYVLVREIGRGGMGAVYQAIRADGEFHQTVAVKLIRRGLGSEQILRRFRQERHILARLDHPNIARLLDAGTAEDGQPYLVMDYVDGVPFTRYCRDRQLDQSGKLRLFLEICAGVQHAHQKLVVHRDLKPANILVTSDGRPKLLDFGIAKWLDPDIAPETVIETATGVRVLTPDYASPEQLRGEAVTVRSDIFALGAILHELLSGEKAVGSHATLAGQEGAIVRRAMRPDPSERYPSADALAADVRQCLEANSRARPMPVSRRLAAAAIVVLCAASAFWLLRKPAALRLDSVAVLPFVNLGVESTGDVVSDGLTEDLITELAAIAGLKVSSRTAVWQYKGKAFDPRQAGRAMGVSAVLEGSVRRSGDQIRIVTQLISVDDGFHLWARSYDRKAGDLLAVQRDVSRLVASELKARLSEAGGWDQKGRPAPGSEAQRAYLEGYRLFQMDEIRNEWTSGVPPRMAAVIDAFERATRLDPQFAAAWAALAEATGWAADFDERSRLAMRQRAGEAARTAIALDPANALASLTLGNLYWSQDWDLRRSEPLLRRAVELSPRSTGMYSDYAGVLVAMERYDDAVDSLRRVQLLEPGSPRPAGRLAELAAMRGDAAGARAYANEALSRDPGYRYALWALAFADEIEGKTDAAESRYRRILELHPSEDRTLASLGHLLGRAGKTVEANRIASRLQSMIERGRRREVFEALVRTALGQREAALGLLEDAWRKRDPNLLNLAVESRFRPLATERRFQQLLARVRALR